MNTWRNLAHTLALISLFSPFLTGNYFYEFLMYPSSLLHDIFIFSLSY